MVTINRLKSAEEFARTEYAKADHSPKAYCLQAREYYARVKAIWPENPAMDKRILDSFAKGDTQEIWKALMIQWAAHAGGQWSRPEMRRRIEAASESDALELHSLAVRTYVLARGVIKATAPDPWTRTATEHYEYLRHKFIFRSTADKEELWLIYQVLYKDWVGVKLRTDESAPPPPV